MNDPFVLKFNDSERKVAAEFLTDWLPFLSKDLCDSCSRTLSDRIRSIDPGASVEDCGYTECSHPEEDFASTNSQLHEESHDNIDDCDTNSLGSWKDGANGWSEHVMDVSTSGTISERVTINSPSSRMSWADMADELEEDEEEVVNKQSWADECDPVEEVGVGMKVQQKPALPREKREYIRFKNVQRKKDFICLERINGKIVNILDGLELHCNVFSAAEQKRIIGFIYDLQEKGKKRELKARTFTAPQKWMRGKGRVTIQFGCCYNYAIDKNGNPPGILQSEVVDPLPNLFKVIIRRLIGWHVLPPSCVPDSCIVNIYEEGDCIPPHIDNHDFVRPFCTVSFLSECNIIFGSSLKIVGPGEFAGAVAIPLPVGSVLVLNGNGADIAKHCVPAVPTKRISITFRKMDESKLPFSFLPEPDLQGIQPLPYGDESSMSDPLKLYPPTVRQPRGNQNFGRNPHSEPQFSRNRSKPANKRRVRVNLST